jgi:hypothetical protein
MAAVHLVLDACFYTPRPQKSWGHSGQALEPPPRVSAQACPHDFFCPWSEVEPRSPASIRGQIPSLSSHLLDTTLTICAVGGTNLPQSSTVPTTSIFNSGFFEALRRILKSKQGAQPSESVFGRPGILDQAAEGLCAMDALTVCVNSSRFRLAGYQRASAGEVKQRC